MTCLGLFSVVTLKTAIENQYFYGIINLGTGMRGVLSTVRGGRINSSEVCFITYFVSFRVVCVSSDSRRCF